MASNILRFPNGFGCRLWVIALVKAEETGVGCYDSNGNPVGWIHTENSAVQERVATALMDCIDAGKRFVQPDWDRLLRAE